MDTSRPMGPNDTPQPSHARAIMVVDDDPELRLVLGEILRDGGYEPYLCDRHADAVERARERRPAAIILDLHMGGMQSGWKILEQLRADPSLRGTPIIVCSADTLSLRQHATALVALDATAVEKPFDIDRLLEVVAQVCGERGRGATEGVNGEAHETQRSVLVVDDDPDILQFVADALSDEGYTVLKAVDGESLELARTAQPTVILLDLMMPLMDGVEVSRRLRADPATAHIPIVAMSAVARLAASPDLQADDWLAKPFTLDQLFTAVGRW